MHATRLAMASFRLKSPSSERNKLPIYVELSKIIPLINPAQQPLSFLEVASGSGEHVAFFAENFPNVNFHPTDVSDETFLSISGWSEGMTNIAEPQVLDW
jgi:tRNA G46 methylase TrmB